MGLSVSINTNMFLPGFSGGELLILISVSLLILGQTLTKYLTKSS